MIELAGGKIKGKLRVTKDPKLLQQLNYKRIPTPFIRNTTNYKAASNNPDMMMDLIQILQNLFIVIDDDPSNSNVVIIPLHFMNEALMKTRKGFPMKLGKTTEVKGEFVKFDLGLGDC